MMKRCGKCGRTANVKPRERRCKAIQAVWGGETHACWGMLDRVRYAPVVIRLEDRLADAHESFAKAITRLKLAATVVSRRQRHIKYFERRIAERDHPKPKAPRKPRAPLARGIRLTEEA